MLPTMAVSRLLKSWARPPAKSPRDSSFWAFRSSCSVRRFSEMSFLSSQRPDQLFPFQTNYQGIFKDSGRPSRGDVPAFQKSGWEIPLGSIFRKTLSVYLERRAICRALCPQGLLFDSNLYDLANSSLPSINRAWITLSNNCSHGKELSTPHRILNSATPNGTMLTRLLYFCTACSSFSAERFSIWARTIRSSSIRMVRRCIRTHTPDS